MILKEGGKVYRIQSLTRQQWNFLWKKNSDGTLWKKNTTTKRRVFLLYTLFLVFLALFFDMSRMGGAVYETAGRLTGYIKGPCISYDTTTQKLWTTPHNTGCANYADRFIIFSALGVISALLVIPIGLCVNTIRQPAERIAHGVYHTISTRNS